MNQILVTEKLYITPELKRKKKIYKLYFFLSVFLMCILVSFYIYAEYDRNKSEETSQFILTDFNENLPENEDKTIAKNNVLIVVLDEEEQDEDEIVQGSQGLGTAQVETTKEGYRYKTIASINIPKIGVQYPIFEGETGTIEEIEALIKKAPTKFWGANPNEVGNFCIVGHNYRNTKFFSKVPTLVKGDLIEITDGKGKMMKYSVYTTYQVSPDDLDCTSQETNGRKEITLITCTNDSKQRVIVKARAL